MALTEITRLRLEGKGFEKVFDQNRVKWTSLAETARKVMAGQISGGSPTVDDIGKILKPMIELDGTLRKYLADKKLVQKYWMNDVVDYILDKVYKPTLAIPKE